MKVKTNEYGNLIVINEPIINDEYLSYVGTVYSNKYGNVDVYEDDKGKKYAWLVDN